MFYSQALTNLKIADTYSMRTLCRMTKMEDTAPVNRSRATGHNHQLSETARENTSNQAYLANGTKEQSSNRKCILQNYHILLPSKIYAHSASVRSTLLCRSLYCPFPKTFGTFSLGQERRSRGVSALVHFRQEPLSRPRFGLCFEQLSHQH